MPMNQLCCPDMMLGTEAPPTDPSGPQAGCMAEQEQEESLHEPIPWLSCPDLVLGTCAPPTDTGRPQSICITKGFPS